MYALISRAGDPTPHVERLDSPALGPTEVRVAVAAAGYTYFDSFVASDHAALGLPDVIGLGFDFSGTVIETGAAVSAPGVGDRVAGLHGNPTAPARAHASEVVVPAADVATVPAGLDLESAAAATLSALAARQALDLLGPERGTLLVTGGAGAVGSWAIALAVRDGWEVDALTRPGTEQLATEVGAAQVLTELPAAAYDAVLDAAALGQAAVGAVHAGGRLVGLKPGAALTAERDVAITAVTTRADGDALAEVLPLAEKGVVPIRVAATRPLSEAAHAYADAQSAPGAEGRWLLRPDQR